MIPFSAKRSMLYRHSSGWTGKTAWAVRIVLCRNSCQIRSTRKSHDLVWGKLDNASAKAVGFDQGEF